MIAKCSRFDSNTVIRGTHRYPPVRASLREWRRGGAAQRGAVQRGATRRSAAQRPCIRASALVRPRPHTKSVVSAPKYLHSTNKFAPNAHVSLRLNICWKISRRFCSKNKRFIFLSAEREYLQNSLSVTSSFKFLSISNFGIKLCYRCATSNWQFSRVRSKLCLSLTDFDEFWICCRKH